MKKGFTLIEVVFAVFVFSIASLGVYESYRALLVSMAISSQKIAAAALLNERFEIARNLPYTSVGTIGGNPSGLISPNQNVVRDGLSFVVDTVIQNVDDPFDGIAPTDTKPADYKMMEVTVSCTTCARFDPVTITGLIAPRNLEP